MKSTFIRNILAGATLLSALPFTAQAQSKVGFLASDAIRERFPEAQQVQQRLESVVNDWKRRLSEMQTEIEQLQFEIQKNRLIWSDTERKEQSDRLMKKKEEREKFANDRFGAGGLYDSTATALFKPVEEKIYAAIQEVSAAEGFDLVWDKSTQPIVYANPKYDITVKIMEKLNIPVGDLKEKLDKQIEQDPRNQKEEEKQTSRRRSRRTSSRSKSDEVIEKEEPTTTKEPTKTQTPKEQPTTQPSDSSKQTLPDGTQR